MIAIIDYGMGNLHSVLKAFEKIGDHAEIVSQPDQIASADKVVLPGVGAFRDAIDTLRRKQLVDPIIDTINSGKYFLGICLGLQLLFEDSYEDGLHKGLGVIKGSVRRFDFSDNPQHHSLKIPHMGWNSLNIRPDVPIYRGLDDGVFVYFVHSYCVVPTDDSVIATTTDHGGPFVSSICRDNLFATQFHPEKSQRVGLQILKNFALL